MKSVNPFSTQSKVRSALKNAGAPVRVPQIRDLIGLAGEEGYNRVHRAICDLMKARQVERFDRGRYRYLADRPESDYCKTQRVMQRIMWMRSKNGKPFTARKISELARCSLCSAQKYLAWLLEKGILRKEGQTQVAVTAYAPLYLGEDAYLANDDWPVMRTWSKTRELDACLNEMREIAGRFFAVEKLDEKTLSDLKAAASGLVNLVGECGKIKHILSQNEGQ
jgi:predicted transcriptional regulator